MSLPLNIDLAQLTPTVGDLNGNADLVLEAWKNSSADLIVFSELMISGYPPEDLILKPSFINAVHEIIEKLQSASKAFSAAALIGAPWRDKDHIYNAAILIENGEIKKVFKKHHLPNYGVFDEKRLFAQGAMPNTFKFRDTTLGIMICEDLWFKDVAQNLAQDGADIFITLNASPFHADKNTLRHKHAIARATENTVPLVYVNQVGGQDELVFDGSSFVLNKKGDFIFRAPEFKSAVFNTSDESANTSDTLESIYNALCVGVRDYVRKNGFTGVVVGMSGGIDSALSATIAADALGAENVRCV
ncbi:MAG: nitrilase-related carbon-nitrogen hydrolase, partial [Pseudomonadota bacterium]